MVRFIGAALLATMLSGCQDSCDERAYKDVQKEISNRLKSPSTAVFPTISEISVEHVEGQDCMHSFSGFVDTQNAFGAVVRMQYLASTVPQEDGPFKIFILKLVFGT